jgi:hypothetical protein
LIEHLEYVRKTGGRGSHWVVEGNLKRFKAFVEGMPARSAAQD